MSKKIKSTKEERFLLNLKEEIIAFFDINEDRALSVNQVHKGFAVRDRKTKELFSELVEELHAEGRLIRNSDGNYIIDNQTLFVTGKVDHVNARFAFVVVGNEVPDIWVNTKDLNGAIDGDTVKVLARSTARKKKSERPEGEVVEIIERRSDEIVGTIEVLPNFAFVNPDSKKIFQDIFIAKDYIKDAKNGDKVIVKVTQWAENERKAEGRIIEVLGKAGENNTEMHAILAEFGLPIHFPEVVEKEAERISEKITKEEIDKRRDFRKVTTFTIDPIDAKDFDDAISFQYLENGNYEIGVHIADVSHYVTENTLLEQEAYKRATSVYLVDRVVPMLPEKLSNGLCSLRPHEDKLTFSAVFEVSPEAKVVKEWFGRTVIHSDKRFSYEEAQEVMDGTYQLPVEESVIEEEPVKKGKKKKKDVVSGNIFKGELLILNSLAHKLRDERFRKGAVNFETVEVRFVLDENGKPLSVYPKIRKDAHKLIEEFMLLANKKVAEFVHNLRKKEPVNVMVYRIHEAPDPEKLKTFSSFAKKFGYNVDIDKEGVSSSLNHLMDDVEGKPEQNILQSLAVRTMSKARYSTDPIGHFGLSFPFYSHFTSPIRRYPDVMAHRLLQHYLDGGEPVEKGPWEIRCKHSSEMEKLASEAERASIKYKQVEFMSLMEEKVFDGIITGVTEFGFFVEITETACEGLVRMVDLKDDFYDLDKDNFRIVGQRNGRVFTFGDPVQVKVKECNLARRSMDLELIGMTGKKGRGSSGERSRSKSKVIPRGKRRENSMRGKNRRK